MTQQHGCFRKRFGRAVLIIAAALSVVGFPSTAWGQSTTDAPPVMPPLQTIIDHNGVNISALKTPAEGYGMGLLSVTQPSVEIGSKESHLSAGTQFNGADILSGYMTIWHAYNQSNIYASASFGSGKSSVFLMGDFNTGSVAGPYVDSSGSGDTLSCSGDYTILYSGGTCSYFLDDGSEVDFRMPSGISVSWINSYLNTHPYLILSPYQAKKPDGEILSSTYVALAQSSGNPLVYLNNVTSSLGYSIWLKTQKTLTSDAPGQAALNTSIDFCTPSSPSPTYINPNPNPALACSMNTMAPNEYDTGGASGNYGSGVTGNYGRWDGNWTYYRNGVKGKSFIIHTVADSSGASTTTGSITTPSGGVISYNAYSPPFTSPSVTQTANVTKNGLTTNYSVLTYITQFEPSGGIVTVSNPDGSTAKYGFGGFGNPLGAGLLAWSMDGLGRVNYYTYEGEGPCLGGLVFCSNPRVTMEVHSNSPMITISNGVPTLNTSAALSGATVYGYTHGALSSITEYPIDGSSPLVTTLGITLTCNSSNYKICNKPQYVKDPKGNQTDYTYDPAHGGVLTITKPADANGVRPQKRFTYSQLIPMTRQWNGSAAVLTASSPVWRLARVSECQTATVQNPASCVGTAQEKVSTYTYNSNNLFLTSQTDAAGDGSLSATVSYTYDYVGNVTSIKGPRTDVDDTRYATYDALRRKVFEIGADPDGNGPLPRQIVHHVYDLDGNESRTESGTGNAIDGSDFVVTQFKRMTYDSVTGQLIKTEEVAP